MNPDDIDHKCEAMKVAKFQIHVTFDLSGHVACHPRGVIANALRDQLEKAIQQMATTGRGTLSDLQVRFTPGDVTVEIDKSDSV
jgi:hypothetical protein